MSNAVSVEYLWEPQRDSAGVVRSRRFYVRQIVDGKRLDYLVIQGRYQRTTRLQLGEMGVEDVDAETLDATQARALLAEFLGDAVADEVMTLSLAPIGAEGE